MYLRADSYFKLWSHWTFYTGLYINKTMGKTIIFGDGHQLLSHLNHVSLESKILFGPESIPRYIIDLVDIL